MSFSKLLLAAFATAASADYVLPADIKQGCARFYLSNPFTYVKGFSEATTPFWTVCSVPDRDKPSKVAIGAGVFAKIKDKYGEDTTNSISFISTGPSCWVNVFSGKQQTGATYEVQPLNDVDLSTITMHDITQPDATSFNDNIMSGYIRSTDANGENPDSNSEDPNAVPVAVWYTFQNVGLVSPNHGCGYFYDADPTAGAADGFAVCFANGQHLAHIDERDMRDRGYYDILKDKKLAYAQAGEECNLCVYSEDRWSGEKEIVKGDEKESSRYLRFNGKSILMISTVYAKEVTPPSAQNMFATVESLLHAQANPEKVKESEKHALNKKAAEVSSMFKGAGARGGAAAPNVRVTASGSA